MLTSHSSLELRRAIWKLLNSAIQRQKISGNIRHEVIEALLFLAEKDSVTIRSLAISQAKILMRKSIPYHLQASLVLFQSFIHRSNGDLDQSYAIINEFLHRAEKNTTRSGNAIKGRLHISHLDNKIHRYDQDVASYIYGWQGQPPLSTLELKVTFRLQSATAKYFQSIGDFKAAQASLEQYLKLSKAAPLPVLTHALVISKLADIYCELFEYDKAISIIKPELKFLEDSGRKGQPYVRLLLSLVEVKIARQDMDSAEQILQKLSEDTLIEMNEVVIQRTQLRRLMAMARVAHETQRWELAAERWVAAIEEAKRLQPSGKLHDFLVAVMYLSLAHVQLQQGAADVSKRSWQRGITLLENRRYEYWVPVIPTTWIHRMSSEMSKLQK